MSSGRSRRASKTDHARPDRDHLGQSLQITALRVNLAQEQKRPRCPRGERFRREALFAAGASCCLKPRRNVSSGAGPVNDAEVGLRGDE
jgi:hypothetical protein